MRVHVLLLAALVPAVTAGFFDRMVARYRQRREHRQETRLQRSRPHYVDYQDELQKLLSDNAASLDSEHPEYAVGVPVTGGEYGERQRRQRLRGLRQRGEGSRGPAQRGQRNRAEDHAGRQRETAVRDGRLRGLAQGDGGPRGRLRGAGMMLFGRRRRPAGRSRPSAAAPPPARPTAQSPHQVRLPTAIDGFDGISPPTPPTRPPAAYIGPHGRLVLRDRDAVTAEPARRRPPPLRRPVVVESPAATRGALVRGCGGRPCPGSSVRVPGLPAPLPTPPPEYQPQKAAPRATPPWRTRKVTQKPTTTTSEQPTSLPSTTTQKPSVKTQQSSKTTPRPSSSEQLPGGAALFEAMTSALDTARVAMLAMLPHVKTEPASVDTRPESRIPDVTLLGQSSTEHSSSVAQQPVTHRSEPKKLTTEDQPRRHPGGSEDVLESGRTEEYVSEEKEQEVGGDKRWEQLLDEEEDHEVGGDRRWEQLLDAAGEEDLEVVHALLHQVRENRAIMRRLRDRQRFTAQGSSTNGEGERRFIHRNVNKEDSEFGDKYAVNERKELPTRDQSSIRAELAAIIASLDREDSRADQLLQTSQTDWSGQLNRHSGQGLVGDGRSKTSFGIPQGHNGYDAGFVAAHPSTRGRHRPSNVPLSYSILRSPSPSEVQPRDKGYSSGIGDVQLRGSSRSSYEQYDHNSKYGDDDHNSKYGDDDLSHGFGHHDGYFHGKKPNSRSEDEEYRSKSLNHPDSTLQLHDSTNFRSGELRDNLNSQRSRGRIRGDNINARPKNAGDNFYLPPDDDRGNKFILGPSDFREFNAKSNDDDTDARDGSSQVRPTDLPFKDIFSSRPGEVHGVNFDSRGKHTGLRGRANHRLSNTESAGYSHNAQLDEQSRDDIFSSWYSAGESNPRVNDAYNFNSRPNHAQFRDDTVSPAKSLVPPSETKPDEDNFRSRPIDVQVHDADSLSDIPLFSKSPYEVDDERQPAIEITVPHRSESPSTPRSEPGGGGGGVAEPSTVRPITTTTIGTTPPTTSQQEPTIETLSFEKLMRMLSQVTQMHPISSQATTSRAIVNKGATTAKPIVQTPKMTKTKVISAPRIDKGYVDHNARSEGVQNAWTTPSSKPLITSPIGSSLPIQSRAMFQPDVREDNRKAKEEIYQDNHSVITPIPIEVKGRPHYAGTLPAPPTVPITPQTRGSTEASPVEEPTTTTRTIPTPTFTISYPPATSPSSLQTKLEPVAVPTASGWEIMPTESLSTSKSRGRVAEAQIPATLPTSGYPATTPASRNELEAFAVPTSSGWLITPMASTAITNSQMTESSSILFDAVAVPPADDWFATTEPVASTRKPIATTIPMTERVDELGAFTTSSWEQTTMSAIRMTEYVTTDEGVIAISETGEIIEDEDQEAKTMETPPYPTTPTEVTSTSGWKQTSASIQTTDYANADEDVTVRNEPGEITETDEYEEPPTVIPPLTTTEVTSTSGWKQTSASIQTTESANTNEDVTARNEPGEGTETDEIEEPPTVIPPPTTTTEVTSTSGWEQTTVSAIQSTDYANTDESVIARNDSEEIIEDEDEEPTTVEIPPPTTTTEVMTTRRQTTTKRPLSLLEQVMMRSVPFTLRKRRYTTPTPMKVSSTEPETEELSPTVSSYREPSATIPKPVEHTTAISGLVETIPTSSSSSLEDVTLEMTPLSEESGQDHAPIGHTQNPLPQMSPKLRLALVQELLKQMQATGQPKLKKTKAKPEETQATTQTYPTQLTAKPDEIQATDQPLQTRAMTQQPVQHLPQNEPEIQEDSRPQTLEDPRPPIEENLDDPIRRPTPSTQIEAAETVEQSQEKEADVNKAVNVLKEDFKVDTKVQSEAQKLAAKLLEGDGLQPISTSATQKPEVAEEDKVPVTPSAFLIALRERAKKRPSVRGSRTRSKPKPRPRAKKRKSLPRGPRPSKAFDEGFRKYMDAKHAGERDATALEENKSEHTKGTRAKLHELVNAENKGESDALSAKDLDTQPSKMSVIKPQTVLVANNPDQRTEEDTKPSKESDAPATKESNDDRPANAEKASKESKTRTAEERDITAGEHDTPIPIKREIKQMQASAVELPSASEAPAPKEDGAKLPEKSKELVEGSDARTSEESVTGHPDNAGVEPLKRPDATPSSEIKIKHAEATDAKTLEHSGAIPSAESKMMPQEKPEAKSNRKPDGKSKEPDQNKENQLEATPSETVGEKVSEEVGTTSPE